MVKALTLNHSRGKYLFSNYLFKASLHRGGEKSLSPVPFKDPKMAGGTKQVIEVADAFCHLCVISLSHSWHESRFPARDEGSPHRRRRRNKNTNSFVLQCRRMEGITPFSLLLLHNKLTCGEKKKLWISHGRIRIGLRARSASLKIISHFQRGANWASISIHCYSGWVKLVPLGGDRRVEFIINTLLLQE